MWNGLVNLGLPLSCTMIHVILGILAMWLGIWREATLIFITYQLTQHIVEKKPFDPMSAAIDVAEFVFGALLATAVSPLPPFTTRPLTPL